MPKASKAQVAEEDVTMEEPEMSDEADETAEQLADIPEEGDAEEGDEGDSDDEKQLEALLAAETKLQQEPESYDAHHGFVTALRNAFHFEKLGTARREMQEKFPLPPEVWIQWIDDERRMASKIDEKRKILDLCALAIQDYLSPQVWMQYLTTACEICFGDDKVNKADVKATRALFERAVDELGGHLTNGGQVWAAFMAFENTLADQQKTNAKDAQKIIRELYKGQLEQPLVGVEEALQEYKEWESEVNPDFSLDPEVGQNYKRSAAELNARVPFEEKVAEARNAKTSGPGEGSPALNKAWADYLDFEMNASKKKNAPRVKLLFERAIADLFLSLDVWLQYLSFLQQYYRKAELLSSVYTRASRNIPWSGKLWGGFIQSLLAAGDEKQAETVFERAMGTTLASAGDFIELCLVMAVYYREQAKVGEVYRGTDGGAALNDRPEVVKLRAVLERASQYLSYLPEEDPADYHYSLLGMWATLEATCLGNVEKARAVWEQLVEARRGDWRAWLDFVAMERTFGTVESCRAVLKRASTEVTGPLYAMLELSRAALRFERQSGDADHVEKAQRKTEKLMAQVRAATAAVTEMEENAAKKRPEGKGGKKDKGAKGEGKGAKGEGKGAKPDKKAKKKAEGEERSKSGPRSNSKSEGGEESKGSQKREREATEEEERNEEEAKEETEENSEVAGKRRKVTQSEDDAGEASAADFSRLKNDKSGKTIFVLNLSWGVSEDELKALFGSMGRVREALHVRDAKGNSKGFGYVQYENKESADNAVLKLDGVELQGRKLTVNHSQAKAPVSDESRDKRTVYVKGVPRVQNLKELLSKKFSSCGSIADIRVAKDHDGNLKKFAFVEFATEEGVEEAVKMDGTLLITKEEAAELCPEEGKKESAAVVIQVTKSKAPTQKEKNQKIKSAKRSEDAEPTRAKGNHKLQLLPRALQQKGRLEPKSDGAPMSNADFKALLAKPK